MKFSLEDCAAAAMQVLNALGIGRVDWVGNAWGGHVGIVLGAIEPQRIKSIVAGAAPLHPLRPSQRMQINALVTIYRLFGPTRLVRNAVEAALLSYDVRRNDVQAVRLVRDAFVAAEKTGMYRAMRDVMLHRPDITDSFRALRLPILLIAGEQDEFWTPDDAMDAARQNRAAVASTIDRSSHLAALEAADLFVQRTLEFWNSNNVSTTSNGFAIGQPVPESLVQAVKHCPKPNDEAGRPSICKIPVSLGSMQVTTTSLGVGDCPEFLSNVLA